MSEIGTGYIIQVDITSAKGTKMSELDFTLEFYTKAFRRVTMTKKDLVCIAKEAGNEYYALLDTARLGAAGVLMCNVKILDPEPRWGSNGLRPVVLKRMTGKAIGMTETRAMAAQAEQREFESGFKVDFNFLYGLPKAEVAYIMYGKFIDQITSFDELTPEMLVNPENTIVSVNAGKLDKTSIPGIEAGNKVLVLIPSDYSLVATKDDGIGGKVPFDTSIMGCNGEKELTVDGTPYRIYGEFMTVSGELFIYVD